MASRAPRMLPLLAAGVVLAVVGCGSDDDRTSSAGEAEKAAPRPVVTARVDLAKRGGETISALAVGEGAVWAALSGCVGAISRIDPDTDELVATIPVGFLVDAAAGEGAVWALGWPCREGERGTGGEAVFRIDPVTNEVVETIPLELMGSKTLITEHMAAGEGGVWVSVQSSRSSGEILRIDPRTNEIAARIPVRDGSPFNVAAKAGAVWVLRDSRPEGASLLRIDPETNEVTATLAREQLEGSGGSDIQPRMAVGEDAIWLRGAGSGDTVSRTAVRVDIETREVVRERLDTEFFYPFAVVDDGVWFGALERLNSDTLEVDATVEAGSGLDAVFEPESRSLWVADQNFSGDVKKQSVVRVDLR